MSKPNNEQTELNFLTKTGDKAWDIQVGEMQKLGFSLFVAMPCYGSGIAPATAMSLLRLQSEWTKIPLPFKVHFHTGNSLIGLARNLCVADFIRYQYSHLLFIDSDVIFHPNEPLRMMAANLPIVGGNYPRRHLFWDEVKAAAKRGEFDTLDTAGIQLTAVAKRGGKANEFVAEADRLPGGFLMIKRDVILKIMADHPELKFATGQNVESEEFIYDLFASGIHKGMYQGEDYGFCKLAIESGFQPWVDTVAQLGHEGSLIYVGPQ